MLSIEVYVGTSGWLYDWNEDGTFDWYLRNSQLNAVELNASFYRFPFRNQVIGWAKKTALKPIRWSVKIHRSISHVHRLGEKSYEIWKKFIELFKPLDNYVDFYLLQMPPTFKKNESNVEKLKKFIKTVSPGYKIAIEFRDQSWFNKETVELAKELNITLVSIDSPIGRWIEMCNNIIYLRLHGRTEWYAYEYSNEELEDLAKTILGLNPKKVYVFFNNNHWMLENARKMFSLLTK
ncbi:MAG: DUF72 domain-containing protein [Ignisphaera sp.]